MQHLQPYATLQGGKYKIERVLGQGGFGITYLAHNTVFDIDVAIKEFFMKDENDRDGSSVTMPITTKQELFHGQMEKFKKEAKRMFAIKNEHIVGVQDLFEENGTAYYVMDFVEGENLAEHLKRTGKPMSEQEVRDILPQILDALKSIHEAGIWHLDLKPANILIDKSGKVKLIDFGASKQLNAQKGGATTSTAISYTNGYAPREQMEQNYDKFGPWTDIYALGATIYTLLTNKRPPLPTDIDDDISDDKREALPFPNNVSEGMKILVLQMMNTNRMQRPQSIGSIVIPSQSQQDSVFSNQKTRQNHRIDSPWSKDDQGEETIIIESKTKEQKEEKENIGDSKLEMKSHQNNIFKLILLLVLLTVIVVIVFRHFVVDDKTNLLPLQQEYASIYNEWRKPWNTQEQIQSIQKRFSSLAEKEYGPAYYMLAIMSEDSTLAQKYYQKSMEFLPIQAKEGDMYAQCCMGEYTKKNSNSDAILWYDKSANQGFSVAMHLLALCYFYGDGVEKDEHKAMEWQIKAAETDDAYEIFRTGTYYAEGKMGFPVDTTKALAFYSKASDKNYSTAMVALGEYYTNKDLNKAFFYYNRAVLLDDAGALFDLGCIYAFGKEQGLDVKKDYEEAIRYFEWSLMYGDVYPVHRFLAYCYVATDNAKKAFEHFSIQAEKYDAEAQYRLYECYKVGYGTEIDLKKAEYWKKRAYELGYKE